MHSRPSDYPLGAFLSSPIDARGRTVRNGRTSAAERFCLIPTARADRIAASVKDDGGMAEDQNIFDEVARIERQADEVLAAARARVKELRREAERQAAEAAGETERRIAQVEAELARQYKTETDQALREIEGRFRQEQEGLEGIRKGRAEEVVAWIASRIREMDR